MQFFTPNDFFRKRIMDLEQALFFNFSQAVLKLPAAVITALDVDELGQVWFIMNRPQQHLHEFEKDFQSRLEFYKKGKDYHIHLAGKSCIIADPEEINCATHLSAGVRALALSTMMLVKFRTERVEYYPHKVNTAVKVISLSPRSTNSPLAFIKTLPDIFKNIIPVFQSH